jgi:hypothetical protein
MRQEGSAGSVRIDVDVVKFSDGKFDLNVIIDNLKNQDQSRDQCYTTFSRRN